LRARRAGVDRALLAALGRGQARRVTLNLFDSVRLEATTDRAETVGGGRVWVGRLTGDSGAAHLSMRGDALAGRIETKDGVFVISSDADGVPVVEEIDPQAFPADLDDSPVPRGDMGGRTAPGGGVSAAADDGTTVDVMIVYTAQARAAAGGTSAMQALASLAVSNTNTAYASSQVVQRLRLVHTAEIAYTQSNDLAVDLDRLTYAQGPSDPSGHLDGVLGLRNTYGADMVQLVVDTGGASGYCGLGWLMQGNAPWFEAYAYSVAERSCMAGNLTTAHELGHNQGLKHAHGDDSSTDADGFSASSWGYKNGTFRTVMAYDCTPSCPRISRFSNPNVLYNGQATGVAGYADNAGALNAGRVTAANWRQATVPTSTPTPTPVPTATPVPTVPASTVRERSDFNGDGRTDLVWQHTDGRVHVWFLNGMTQTGGAYINAAALANWRAAASADMNGDGRQDLLWQHTDGRVYVWYLNGTAQTGGAYAYAQALPDWRLSGAGDVNGDNRPDLVWQHTDGRVYVWFMNGTAQTGGGFVYQTPLADWRVKATGDLNRDGRLDLVLQHTDGRVYVWYLNGLAITHSAPIHNQALANWYVRGTGDFNGDGHADLLWQHSDGRPNVWFLVNGVLVSNQYIHNQPIPGWTIVAAK
jgi:hypothetical protein